MILDIIEQLRSTTKRTEKEQILSQHKDNELFKKVLKATYDSSINYWIKKIPEYEFVDDNLTLDVAINNLIVVIASRQKTGNEAIQYVKDMLYTLTAQDAKVLELIIQRDLDCGIGIKSINKVFGKDFIKDFSTLYMRCSTFDEKRFEKLKKDSGSFIVQEKMDGLFANVIYVGSEIDVVSRNGKRIELFENRPELFEGIKKQLNELSEYGMFKDDIVLNGELLIFDTESESLLSREEGNGILNSKNKEWKSSFEIHYVVWDIMNHESFLKGKWEVPYIERYRFLKCQFEYVSPISLVESKICSDMKEVDLMFNEVVEKGGEGVIIKSMNVIWKSGTSTQQLKYKKEIDCELEVTNVLNGKTGKLKGTPAIFECQSADGKVIVNVGSGMTDKFRKELEANPDSFIGRIVTVRFFGLQKAKNSETWSLYLPRLIEVRNDKDEADTLEKIQELIEMKSRFK